MATLKDQGYLAMGGQIIDASIKQAVPKQRNSRQGERGDKGWRDAGMLAG